jgi:DNA-binding transcriptional regulator LsrR (DeoR family)
MSAGRVDAVAQRPTELVLTARVARRYFLDGSSKTEIAEELHISRFRVARLLESARRTGLVRIEIHSPSTVDTDLSARLQEAFGLSHAVVLDVPDDNVADLRRHLAGAAADVLCELTGPDDVVGLAWARSLSGIGKALTNFVPCQVVQLTGALSRPDGNDVLELVRQVASAGGGQPHFFYAPMVVGDAATTRTLKRQPDVVRAAALVPQVTIAAVGIGAWRSGLSTLFDAFEPDAREKAGRLGVTAEISGVFIDAAGRPVPTALSKRIIGISADQLAGINTVLAIAYGDAKAEAVRAAVRGGLVSALITHASLARRLLSNAPSDLATMPDATDVHIG